MKDCIFQLVQFFNQAGDLLYTEEMHEQDIHSRVARFDNVHHTRDQSYGEIRWFDLIVHKIGYSFTYVYVLQRSERVSLQHLY